ncbi:uncharacterized protein G2W53_015112 [Senna tora]|uniref:Uncharacterized protein n=1 Tax=Senna tora TaxID=362788 RepID=A0A834WUR2_9FABA|nr:uncharacterized protein G2W53_015112 [Senna tora]
MPFVAMEDGKVRQSRNAGTATDSSSFFVVVSGTVHCDGHGDSSLSLVMEVLGLQRKYVSNFSISFQT